MTRYEYKVVPAPTRGLKARAVKTPEGRFALGVETVLNQMGAEGWEFQRAELLPSDERSGLTGSTQHWRNLLVFRRPVAESIAESAIESAAGATPDRPAEDPVPQPDSARPTEDNGVEESGTGQRMAPEGAGDDGRA